MAPRSSNNDRERRHFIEWLNSRDDITAPAGGWLANSDKDSFPEFNVKVLKEYASWLLDTYKKGSLAHTQAAINHYYQEAGIPAPWLGRHFSRTMSKYAEARLERAIDNNEHESGQLPMGCRVPVPEDVMNWILVQAEAKDDEDPNLAKLAIMLIAFLFLLRASSLFFEKGDVRFVLDGDGKPVTLIVDSTCVKMQSKAKKHQMRCPAPPSSAGPDHPRARVFEIIAKAIKLPAFYEIQAPETASSAITGWMRELIPASVSSLPNGEKITSHSFRKAGASAMCSLGLDIRTKIMPWGVWKCIESVENYVVQGYLVTRFSGGMWDWILPANSPFEWANELD